MEDRFKAPAASIARWKPRIKDLADAPSLEATGKRFPTIWVNLAILIALPVIVFFVSGTDLEFSIPTLKGFNYEGGVDLPPELLALVLGLSLYTATYVAEIVRAGILAVNTAKAIM
mgnify:CR=1 FL=1